MVVLSKLVLVAAMALAGWAYKATRPPAAAILGGPGGPAVTSPRVQLKDGRHLAYREGGVTREIAEYKIIFFHGFGSTKESEFPVSQELAEELKIYLLYFDRAGYGDSDANPKRGLESDATDVEELADALHLGEKFYVVGTSMGGYIVWSCLNYIPHRLAGAALVVPAVNYWWPMPADVSESAYSKLHAADRRTFWIAHHMPWLFYAWFKQKLFRIAPVMQGQPEAFTEQDWEILTAIQRKERETGQVDMVSTLLLPSPMHSCRKPCKDAPCVLFSGEEGHAAGDVRFAVPRRDDPVRRVGVQPDGDEEPVPRRRRRGQHLAGARGQDRPGGGAALRGGEAPVGAVPRAPRGRTSVRVRGRAG
ncbi:hypothetical protein GUJ93_ZPchr0001g31290 [Zizania palustris]|uniref:AB hydrolase-1 domain-containing protein n=1 Tax=Zizania palustris TaxID=103762 RepID=A0A8J5VCK4_ZIZPA|nr:hypothetical protein GUJ93_ZPchr0001g31290 [Zizania palustris]